MALLFFIVSFFKMLKAECYEWRPPMLQGEIRGESSSFISINKLEMNSLSILFSYQTIAKITAPYGIHFWHNPVAWISNWSIL